MNLLFKFYLPEDIEFSVKFRRLALSLLIMEFKKGSLVNQILSSSSIQESKNTLLDFLEEEGQDNFKAFYEKFKEGKGEKKLLFSLLLVNEMENCPSQLSERELLDFAANFSFEYVSTSPLNLERRPWTKLNGNYNFFLLRQFTEK